MEEAFINDDMRELSSIVQWLCLNIQYNRWTVTELITSPIFVHVLFLNNNIFMANEQDGELKLALASSRLLFYTIRNQLKQISLLSISATANTWPTANTHKNIPKFKVSVSISNRNKQFSNSFALFYLHFMLEFSLLSNRKRCSDTVEYLNRLNFLLLFKMINKNLEEDKKCLRLDLKDKWTVI